MNIETITELRKNIEKIYSSFRERLDPNAWKQAITKAYEEEPEETTVKVVDFVRSHTLMPASVYRAVFYAIDLRNRPAQVAEVYGYQTVRQLLKRMSDREPIRYDYIASGTSDEEIKKIMDLAKKAFEYMNRGQIFLAGTAIDELCRYCPTHPDVLDLQREFAAFRVNGGVDLAFVSPHDCSAVSDEEHDIAYYESRIAEDYTRYECYYPLGRLYLENEGDEWLDKADYLADIMLDLGQSVSEACLLKAEILEAKGAFEDALFYADMAMDEDKSDQAAADKAISLLKQLDSIEEKKEIPALAVIKEKPTEYEEEELTDEIKEIAENTDRLASNSRLTEAYYELVKVTARIDSNLLTYKKAYILYLMKRAAEARVILEEIPEDSCLYSRAQELICDIDYSIVDSRKYEDIKPEVLAQIFFNTGNYADALKIYRKIQPDDLSQKDWSLKGRCELETGYLDSALESFSNALNRPGDAGNIREITGMIYQVKGDKKMAMEMYEEALKTSENSESLCTAKAMLLYQAKSNEELLSFRDDMERKGVKPCDMDGYAGLIMMNDYPHNVERSLYCLERAQAGASENVEFYITAINEYINRNQLYRALLTVEKGLAATDNAQELYMKKAELMFLLNKLDAAETLGCILLTGRPDSPEIQFLLGRIYSEKKENKESIKWLRSAAALDKNNHKFAYALADKCFETGDINGALTNYSRAIELDETDSISLKRRALIYNTKEQDDKALEDLDKALALSPDDAEIYLIIGNILAEYELEDNPSRADDTDLSVSLEKQPETSESQNPESEQPESENPELETPTDENSDKDDQDNKQEAPDDAVDQNAQESKKATDDQDIPDTPARAGRSIIESIATKDSEYYYDRAIALDPENRQCYLCRAKYLAENRQITRALTDIQRAIELSPDEGDAYMVRGIIHHIAGDNEKAIKDFRKVIEIEPANAQAFSYISKCFNAGGDYEKAIEACEEGLKADKEFLNLYVNRGVAHYSLGKYNLAVEDFRRVIIKKNEVNTAAVESAYRFRGMAYEKLNQKEDAINDYRMLMKYNPDITDIRLRLEKLEKETIKEEPKKSFSLFGWLKK